MLLLNVIRILSELIIFNIFNETIDLFRNKVHKSKH